LHQTEQNRYILGVTNILRARDEFEIFSVHQNSIH
jgi:hypothetical protein